MLKVTELKEKIITAVWKSTCYVNVFGTCEIRADDKLEVTLIYDEKSDFRSSTEKKFTLIFEKGQDSTGSVRIIGQTSLKIAQMFCVTFSVKDHIIYGYYSSIFPMDSGSIIPTGDVSLWHQLLE